MRLRIAIRADAGPTVGFGHVMRCITLGAALADRGHEVTLVSRDLVSSLEERCRQSGIGICRLDADERDGRVLKGLEPDVVLVDGYHLAAVAATLHNDGLTWIGIDDNRELPLTHAAAVLNHNLFANRAMYPELPENRVWAGPNYALLRKDLTALAGFEMQPPVSQNVLLSMGGADPLGLSFDLAVGLAEAPNTVVRVASHPARSTHEELEALIAGHEAIEFASADLIASFSVSDIAVIGAGTTLWETAYLGIPTVALITADNQQDGARSAGSAGIATVLDARAASSSEIVAVARQLARDRGARIAMMRQGRDLFDGNGPNRAVLQIEALTQAAGRGTH